MKESTLKKKKKRLVFRSVMLAVMVGLIAFALISNNNSDKSVVAKGEEPPDFKLKKFGTEETVSLSDYEGQGVMINFWATYCEPCKDEMPYMEELYDDYKEQGVEILAINLDSTDLVVQRFLDRYGLSFPILHDKDGQVMDEYNVGQLPSTLFINPEGEVEEQVVGPLTLDRLEGYLNEITPES
ncbi:thiol-disulfide oxidoreductase ResA [Halobacillus andaensis]|uniref:Thiol-disulfide oxidoreductase ResA n=1 Tax=Halobacillus andaensis TaxID=1176239 RepID=A0A917EV12_HALAA|nr:thiol-disulfide oxidoreductase ResA [Halobacillus andaensis]MBP2003226.1 peroxiredoxin [Halobacillus andaensis]GGF09037.1 thiol-disulfide oxidoreductase ResA [Halobacillus andaensis]